LAQSDLRRVIQRYDGTVGGTEAELQLAQLYYNAGKYKDGIEVLSKSNPVDDMAYDVQMMIGAGYEAMNQGAAAARAYEEAVKKARFSSERDMAKANSARAYLSAGNSAQAIKIWTDLANDPKSTLAPEARVRLGEAEAKPVKI
jgi:TolA-binding protein